MIRVLLFVAALALVVVIVLTAAEALGAEPRCEPEPTYPGDGHAALRATAVACVQAGGRWRVEGGADAWSATCWPSLGVVPVVSRSGR